MKVHRIVANIQTSDVANPEVFYHGVLDLELVMDHGWIRTYGSNQKMTVQVSFATQGGSDTPVPDLSIEVDDIQVALRRIRRAGLPVEYGPKRGSAVSTFAIHWASSSTCCSMSKRPEILQEKGQ